MFSVQNDPETSQLGLVYGWALDCHCFTSAEELLCAQHDLTVSVIMRELLPDREVLSCERALPASSQGTARGSPSRVPASLSPEPGCTGEELWDRPPRAAFTAVSRDFVLFVLGTWMRPFGKPVVAFAALQF